MAATFVLLTILSPNEKALFLRSLLSSITENSTFQCSHRIHPPPIGRRKENSFVMSGSVNGANRVTAETHANDLRGNSPYTNRTSCLFFISSQRSTTSLMAAIHSILTQILAIQPKSTCEAVWLVAARIEQQAGVLDRFRQEQHAFKTFRCIVWFGSSIPIDNITKQRGLHGELAACDGERQKRALAR